MTKPGEFLKVPVRYLSDDGRQYSFMQKHSNATAVGNTVLPMLDNQGIPERWKYRYIIVQVIFNDELFKRIITIGSPNNPLFLGLANQVWIDGVWWRITGRKGERRRGPYHS